MSFPRKHVVFTQVLWVTDGRGTDGDFAHGR